MAPKSQTRRQRGGLFNMFRRKNNTAKTFGEKFAPVRGLASYSAQQRLIASNVKKVQDKLSQTNSLINAAKAKNAAYNSLDNEYKNAVADQQTKWNEYTAAKAKVYSLLMKRQAASKGIMDRARGVAKHGILGLFSRKSYEENVKANAKAAEAKKAALLARSKVVSDEIKKEKEKREAFEKAIKERNEEAEKILADAEKKVETVKNAPAATVAAAVAAPGAAGAASGVRNPFNNWPNNKPANKAATKPANKLANKPKSNTLKANSASKGDDPFANLNPFGPSKKGGLFGNSNN